MSMITIDDFSKVEIKIGTVLEAEKIPEADRLIKLVFDFGMLPTVIPDSDQESIEKENGSPIRLASLSRSGSGMTNDKIAASSAKGETPRNDERDVRQIMSAIAPFYPDPSVLVGKQIAVCTNLEPRKFKGYESQGMIMATDSEDGGIVLMVPEKKVKPGARIH